MANVVLGLGSNLEREENLRSGLAALDQILSHISISPIYESPAYGFVGQNFYNLVVTGQCDLPLDELANVLRALEYQHGRPKNATKFSSRHLDIDILLFDELVGSFHGIELPRDEIATQAYVLKPLMDVLGDKTHPALGLTFSQMWRDFSGDKKQVWQSEFQFAPAVSGF